MGNCFTKNKAKRQTFKALPHLTTEKRGVINNKSDLPVSFKSFLKLNYQPLATDYKVLTTIGSGAFSEVKKCLHRATGRLRAVKRIMKKKLHPLHYSMSTLLQEFEIMVTIDHPNIIRCYDFYEDKSNFYLVTELCEGGMLFDRIVEMKHFSEQDAASVMYQVFSALAYCHSIGIVHRDLKPENILLDDTEGLAIRVADFGSSSMSVSTADLSGLFGTAPYLAPETIDNHYSEKCDIWSCGIILYVLLTGKAPYGKKRGTQIIKQLRKKAFSPSIEQLESISQPARYLLYELLRKNPKLRLTAVEALANPWFHSRPQSSPASCSIVLNLKNLYYDGKLKEAVKVFIASQITYHRDASDLKEAFQSMDENGDGKLSRAELLTFFLMHMTTCDALNEVDRLLDLIDRDNSGCIDYSEFISATLDKMMYDDKCMLEYAFQQFDLDGNGVITAEEIRTVLQGDLDTDEQIWNDIVREVDSNNDGKIDFREFLAFMSR